MTQRNSPGNTSYGLLVLLFICALHFLIGWLVFKDPAKAAVAALILAVGAVLIQLLLSPVGLRRGIYQPWRFLYSLAVAWPGGLLITKITDTEVSVLYITGWTLLLFWINSYSSRQDTPKKRKAKSIGV